MVYPLSSALAFAFLVCSAYPGAAQKQGGTLRVYHRDTPPSASIHEESTITTVAPFMGVFNNLVLFDQSAALEGPEAIMGAPSDAEQRFRLIPSTCSERSRAGLWSAARSRPGWEERIPKTA